MKQSNNRRGFTLVELLVAMALFSIVISVAIGGFTRALRTQRQITALIAANSNVSLAIEQMAREIRVGFDFECVGGSPCDEFTFRNSRAAQVTYRFSGERVERRVGSGAFEPVTAENVRVRSLSFRLLEDPGGSNSFPPRITIAMGVSAKTLGVDESVTNIQTTVSARQF